MVVVAGRSLFFALVDAADEEDDVEDDRFGFRLTSVVL